MGHCNLFPELFSDICGCVTAVFRELVFEIDKISSNFNEIILIDVLHHFVRLNCFTHLDGFTYTAKLNNNLLKLSETQTQP